MEGTLKYTNRFCGKLGKQKNSRSTQMIPDGKADFQMISAFLLGSCQRAEAQTESVTESSCLACMGTHFSDRNNELKHKGVFFVIKPVILICLIYHVYI